MDELAKNCVDIATHKIGCSVVQTCLLESGILAIDLIRSIISNATLLAEDPYGFEFALLNSYFFETEFECLVF